MIVSPTHLYVVILSTSDSVVKNFLNLRTLTITDSNQTYIIKVPGRRLQEEALGVGDMNNVIFFLR